MKPPAPPRIITIIPALNEEASIGRVIADLPDLITMVIVGNNGSTDGTAEVARAHSAVVVDQPERGYGAACLAALDEAGKHRPDIILFIDGDYSDDPTEAVDVLQPILDGTADMVIGSRATGQSERGSLTPPQRFGNWLSTRLIRLFWGVRFTDLGPFRAITWEALERLNMQDRNFGWTVEMQIKAAKHGLRCTEIPVRYRNRIGTSKVSGTLKGSLMAGVIILKTIARERLRA